METIKAKRSLGQFILTIFIAAMVITQVVVGSLIAFRVSDTFSKTEKESVENLNKQIGFSIENYLSGYEVVIRSLAGQNALKKVMDNSSQEDVLLQVLESYVEANPNITAIYAALEDGRVLMRPARDDLGDVDPRDKEWYIAAKNAGDFVWIDPYFDTTINEMVVTAVHPVYNASNQFIGVIAADINLKVMNAQTKDIKIGEKGYPMVIDKNNIIMTHADESKVGTELVTQAIKDTIANKQEDLVYTYEENGVTKTKYGSVYYMNNIDWSVVSTFYLDEIQAESNRIIILLVVASAIAIAAGSVLVLLFTKRFNRNIKKLIESMQRARTGELGFLSKVKSKDEIGVLSAYFDETLLDLSKLVGNILNASSLLTTSAHSLAATSEEVSASFDEITKTVEDIAVGAQDQAQDAEKSVNIGMSLSERLNELNDYTNHMVQSAKETASAYSDGIESINTLQNRNAESMTANNSIEEVIRQLNDRTIEIGVILDSISNISEQTNLLALNASIEAARAGEHGRGFSVVAEEIRKLAEQSAASTNEVRDIVINIQSDSANSVERMSSLKTISQKQSEAVLQVVDSFEVIKSSYDIISENISQISDSVLKVNEDKEHILESIESISAVSEETAAASEEVTATMDQQAYAVEEVAKAAQDLNQISSQLNQEIEKFKI